VSGRKGTPNLQKCLDAMSRLSAHVDATKRDCLIGAGFVVQKDNWSEMYDAAHLYERHGAHNMRISGLFTPEKDAYFDGWFDQAAALERRIVSAFGNNPSFKVHGRFSQKVSDTTAAPDYDECHYQHLTTYIGGDGNLYRCCVTSYNKVGMIGSVRASGFKGLWDSELKRLAFEKFSAAKSCTMCQFNDRNRSIGAALTAPELPPEPEGSPVHVDFV